MPPLHAPLHFLGVSTTCFGLLHYISTTCLHYIFATLHYMSGNDYRNGKRQVSLVVDVALWAAVKGEAAAKGVSVTALVTGLLEQAVTMTRVEGEQPGTPLFELDWDALMDKGRESRSTLKGHLSLYDEARASVLLDRSGDGQTISLAADPLEEIA